MSIRGRAAVVVKDGLLVAKDTLASSIGDAQRMDVSSRPRRAPAVRKGCDDSGVPARSWESVGVHRCMPLKRLRHAIMLSETGIQCPEPIEKQMTVRLPDNDEERHLTSGAILNLFGLLEDAREKQRSVLVYGHYSSVSEEWKENTQAAMLAALIDGDGSLLQVTPSELRSVALTFREFWQTKVVSSSLNVFTIRPILRRGERKWLRGPGSETAHAFRACGEIVSAVMPLNEFEPVDWHQVLVIAAPEAHARNGQGREECRCVVLVTQGQGDEGSEFYYVAAIQKALWIARSKRKAHCRPRVRVVGHQTCLRMAAGQPSSTSADSHRGEADADDLHGLRRRLKRQSHIGIENDRCLSSSSRRLRWNSFEHDISSSVASVLGLQRYQWSPSSHWLLPKSFRAGIVTLLLCHRFRSGSSLALLPMELLFELFTAFVIRRSAWLYRELPAGSL